MKRSDEIRTRQEQIRSDLAALEGKADPAEEDHVRTDALLEEFDELAEELTPLAQREDRIAAVRSAAGAPAGREAGAGAPDLVTRTSTLDPYADPVAIRSGSLQPSEYRTRALSAVEQAAKGHLLDDTAAERATVLLESEQHLSPQGRRDLAQHVLRTGSAEYRAAFADYLADPETYRERAAMSLTGANGGYLVPFVLDPTIILTNAGSANPYRQIATTKTTTTNSWNGVTSAGVNAAWLAEATEAADSSPTVGQLAITAQKAAAWLYGSYEFAEDSDFAQSLPRLLADAKDRLEEAAFTAGTGSGQPYGSVTRGTVVAGPAGAVFSLASMLALQASLPARFRGPGSRPAWVAALPTINAIRGFDTAGGASVWANPGQGAPEQFLGRPLYESSTISGALTATAKPVVYGDWSQYYIVDRIGMSVMYEPMVKGANQRPTGQSGWFAFWRTGADVAVPAALRVAQITA